MKKQSYKEFDIIVIDQNNNNLIDDIIQKWSRSLSIQHIKSPFTRGISAARNLAYQYIQGDIVTFSDDDCWYESDTFERANELIAKADVISLNMKLWKSEDDGRLKLSGKSRYFSKYSLFDNFMEASLFFKREDILKYPFNEKMGIGCASMRWSDEGADVLVRMLKDGYKFYHYGNIHVNHPDNSGLSTRKVKRSYYYGLGRGYFLRLNHYDPIYVVIRCWVPYLLLVFYSLILVRPAMVRFYIDGLWGRIRGYFEKI